MDQMDIGSILAAKGSFVATVQRSLSLLDATAMLRDHGIGALVVSADGRSIDGIASERDVVRAVAAHGSSVLGREIGSVMTTDVVTCRRHDTIDQVMALMTARRVRHVPVTDDRDELVGVISIGDVVKARLQTLESQNQTLFEYINAR